ncbi:MAG TPA: peptidoglycan DD-metalloendopeptidase family protein, partial [Spirochaetota bacterium]|nr:peptidoglycan DD-metalloendopeptidase family protein [Spirochaetota bacterium]
VMLSIAVLPFIIIIPNYKKETEDLDNEILNDEIEKNNILQSASTDYSGSEDKGGFRIVEYIVRPGENLSSIAENYGVSMDTICGSNGLRSYDFIRSGICLRIPNKDGMLYRMKRGNNITSLARKYRVSLEKIITENDLRNPDFIAVNTEIFIPDAKPLNIIRGFMWPVTGKYITCGYGWRKDPFQRINREFHQGIDIRSRYEWIRASKYGKVTYTGWLGGYGRTIVVAHPGGWKTLYGHLSRIIVRRGQYVKQGQPIGKSGNTGRSTGPHLHFEVLKNGQHKNPYSYLKKVTGIERKME